MSDLSRQIYNLERHIENMGGIKDSSILPLVFNEAKLEKYRTIKFAKMHGLIPISYTNSEYEASKYIGHYSERPISRKAIKEEEEWFNWFFAKVTELAPEAMKELQEKWRIEEDEKRLLTKEEKAAREFNKLKAKLIDNIKNKLFEKHIPDFEKVKIKSVAELCKEWGISENEYVS